jgi:uncharacterized membrane protein (DUF485 family)
MKTTKRIIRKAWVYVIGTAFCFFTAIGLFVSICNFDNPILNMAVFSGSILFGLLTGFLGEKTISELKKLNEL